MRKFILSFAVTLLTLSAISCSSLPRVAVQPGFWKMSGTTVGIAFTPQKKAGAYRLGSQGLLDVIINEIAAGSLEAHLQTLDLTEFDDIVDRFQNNLERKGFRVKRIVRPIEPDSLEKLPGGSAIDYRSLASKDEIDFLILFSVRAWGTSREYYGFIPLEAPKALCAARGILVDVRSNITAWNITMAPSEAIVAVTDPWDAPPDFPNVTHAVRMAIRQAKDFLVNDFFQNTLEKAQKASQ